MVTVTASLMSMAIPVTRVKMDIMLWKRAITLGVKVNTSSGSWEKPVLMGKDCPDHLSSEFLVFMRSFWWDGTKKFCLGNWAKYSVETSNKLQLGLLPLCFYQHGVGLIIENTIGMNGDSSVNFINNIKTLSFWRYFLYYQNSSHQILETILCSIIHLKECGRTGCRCLSPTDSH